MNAAAPTVGVVVIGRNEGPRLFACLESLGGLIAKAVYVDSGSTDGSAEVAERLGAAVVQLDMTVPFTAARARNAGFAELRRLVPGIELVQFVDGDCQIAAGWLAKAAGFLSENRVHAIVCGRRRERFPDATIYNALCDREWDTPVGDALACGGDCLARVDALASVGAYAADLIAGEEPEMCVRLRAAGWKIHRLDAEMTLHDANIRRLGQWWSRSKRAGHAFAEVAHRHLGLPEGIWGRNVLRAVFWGCVLPLVALFGAVAWTPAFLLLFAAYPLQIARIAMREGGGRTAWLYATFALLAKFPEMQGVAQYALNRLMGRRQRLIEYK
ncbi:glycosyltransferase [Aminobacter aganoensis]|uniref:Glycosyltransferase involved in cell wall biosynthesis n=1 Tax=Aminobacter aganoensis TaxID=83264 RepID=A0A7X0KMU6_9HYPH|nr:glycosyltransferase family A protein [Aminobacter aganoensis]MBB6356502.1 glycosyltransferase involved in cell wall biosynthesis [Aminobacter aganoensis]